MPAAPAGLVNTGGAGSIKKVNVPLPDPAVLLAATVVLKVPVAVGAPLMSPVPEFMDNPGGSPDAL
jgi:hypothetical protein